MTRLGAVIGNDLRVQLRNGLYVIGAVVSVIIAAAMAWLARPDQMALVAAAALILIGGGSTLLYVGAMIVFEKDEGTLRAIMVSPVTPSEYIGSKIATLTLICLFETAIMVGGAFAAMALSGPVDPPNFLPLIAATIATGGIYTAIGIVLVVRFDTITAFLVPVSLVAIVLQLPFVYFAGIFPHPALLAIPTSAPAMLSLAAWRDLAGWEWGYSVGYTLLLVTGLSGWARAAFVRHVVGEGRAG
ncbi:ABC transporter permease [Pelagibacterium halotolerans]|uniref:fluoroquinolone export ABC transporter permease subunit n=1 Tax=Pelagibacterium halotolerans TaxID=531813 RepID=UPI00384EE8DE